MQKSNVCGWAARCVDICTYVNMEYISIHQYLTCKEVLVSNQESFMKVKTAITAAKFCKPDHNALEMFSFFPPESDANDPSVKLQNAAAPGSGSFSTALH